MRGLAVLLVLIYHIHRAVVTAGFSVKLDPQGLAYRLLETGCQGVDLFFLISGFLITGSLLRQGSVSGFLWNRAVRIYPAFLGPHLLVFCLGPLLGYDWLGNVTFPEWLLHFATNLLFLPGVFKLPIAQIVAWSLSYEFFFYLLAATALGISKMRPLKMWTAAAGSLWLAATTAFLIRCPSAWFFVVGVLTWAVMDREPLTAGRIRFRSWSTPKWLVAGVETGLMLGGLAGLLWFFDSRFPVAVVAGAVAFVVACRDTDGVRRILGARSLQYLGTISYSLYLWHMFVLFAAKRILVMAVTRGLPEAWCIVLCVLVGTLGSLAVAHWSWRLTEQGVCRWIRARSGDRPVAGMIRDSDAVAVTFTGDYVSSRDQVMPAESEAA